jgi:hypothetical protein
MPKTPKKSMKELSKGFEEFSKNKDLEKDNKKSFEKGIEKLVKGKPKESGK